jgi:hypothetical protein
MKIPHKYIEYVNRHNPVNFISLNSYTKFFLMKNIFTACFCLFSLLAFAQKKDKYKYFDVEAKKLGMTIKVVDAVSTEEYIKCRMQIKNTNDFFVIADASKFHYIVNGQKLYCRDKIREIPMNGKKSFGPDAKGKKTNVETASFVIDGLHRTSNHKIVNFPELDALRIGKTDAEGLMIELESISNEKNEVKAKVTVTNLGHNLLIFNPSVIELRDQGVPVNNAKPRTKNYLLKKGEKEWVTVKFNVTANTGEKILLWNDAFLSADIAPLPPIEIALLSNKNQEMLFKYTLPEVPAEINDEPSVQTIVVNEVKTEPKPESKNSTKPKKDNPKKETTPSKANTKPVEAEPKTKEVIVARGDGETSELHAAEVNYDDVGKYYALLIGVSNYNDPAISDLDSLPVKDARNLANTLTTYYTFQKENVKVLNNPTRREIVIALDEIAKKATTMDNVLIFYAGHGHYEDESDIGYWLPKDAEVSNSANWMYNDQLVASIRKIRSLHTLLISDACFSGSIFKNRAVAMSDASDVIKKKYQLPSRKALTSGTLKTVPNKSVFIKYLIDRLTNNKEKYFTSSQLFQAIETPVGNNSSSLPQFGVIQNVGDEGGDFIFMKK